MKKLEAKLKEEGISFLGLDTYRSFVEQAALYAQGRSKPGRKVTNAKPGHSYHNVRRARDYALLNEEGKLDWMWMASIEAQTKWDRLGELAEECGLRWGGRWRRPDRPHVEDTFCLPCQLWLNSSSAEHFDEDGNCKSKPTEPQQPDAAA